MALRTGSSSEVEFQARVPLVLVAAVGTVGLHPWHQCRWAQRLAVEIRFPP